MKILIQQVTILDEGSPYHQQKVDILLENGIIKNIQSQIEKTNDYEVHNFEGCYLSVGFCDLITQIGEPGFEYRDDVESVAKSAIFGGFTTICALPNNQPITQNKSDVEFILNRAKSTAIHILPFAALTKDFNGKSPTEMMDLNKAGAIGFTDIPHSIKDNGVLLRALQYTQQFGGVVFALPFDKNLVHDGQVNESIVSVKLGFRGIPEISEYLAVYQSIEILKYAGGKLHLTGISSEDSIKLIAQAKKDGLNISASCFVHHLISTEENVATYNSNFKVFPPLKNDKTRLALIEAVKNKTIDVITTQHTPLDSEVKNLEFEYADYGMIGMETALGLLLTYTDIPLEILIDALAYSPRKIINRQLTIDVDKIGEFTIFNTSEEWNFEEQNILSKSKNTPYIGKALKGKVKAIFNKGVLTQIQ